RNNTPIVQDFQGLSAYSSILNKNLLFFYLYDLEIDMGRESVSRYATLGNRANLHSMLQGKYVIRPHGDDNVPYGFTEIYATENFAVFENNYVLPFARSTSTVYEEQQVLEMSPLMREQAMLTGIILEQAKGTEVLEADAGASPDFDVTAVGGPYDGNHLQVTEESGGLSIDIEALPESVNDLFVSFHLENKAADKGFPQAVNDYHTTRKSNQSDYKAFVDDLKIRIPAEQQIEIRLPKGDYELTGIQLSAEDYKSLRQQADQPDLSSNLIIDGSNVSLNYANPGSEEYLKLPIPYERGWKASVNGQKVEVLKADFAFIAVPLESGDNQVSFSYSPPFFKPALIISVVSALLGLMFVFRKRKE